jgi:signal transduction histidine kinase
MRAYKGNSGAAEGGRKSAANGRAPSPDLTEAGRERERIRVALHDGLGQLLTSISFLASSLRQNLAARELPEATQAAEILSLTGRAISQTQDLVREPEPTQPVL